MLVSSLSHPVLCSTYINVWDLSAIHNKLLRLVSICPVMHFCVLTLCDVVQIR